MKVFWFVMYLVGAFMWFAWAFDLMHYDPWMITLGFCICGFNSIIWALGEIAE